MTSTSTTKTTAAATTALDGKALLYMSLLAFQFGLQPTLTRQFTPDGICRSTVILVQEVLKFFLAFAMLNISGSAKSALQGWSVSTWLAVAVVPAALYAVQNVAALTAYQTLDALTFNVLNQTKTLSAALCCYLVMGRKQSQMQVVSLFLLLLAALVMERIVSFDMLSADKAESVSEWDSKHLTHGVAPILLASFISGLTGALTQKNLQSLGGTGRNPYLFSMELCAASVIILAISMLVSPDGKRIADEGFWHGWTKETWLPIVTNSMGGIVVGLVTKYAGSVRKGFALIFGMLLSGLVQAFLQDVGLSNEQIIGGVLAAVSLWMHATNPYTPKRKPKVE